MLRGLQTRLAHDADEARGHVMPWYERCAHCGRIHTPQKFTAVYIGQRYYCQPSCANAHREKLKTASTLIDT